jgi:serine/threonine protein kinase
LSAQIIGRYEIERKLGQGGMASVFLGRDPFMKRQVAIKVLPREFTADPQFRARFQREAEIIAALEHSHIVPVYDFGQHEDQPYIVMRFMTGQALDDRLVQRPFSLDEAVNILLPLASALDYAHTRGVVHRDLKPANIMFDSQNEPFISDFGIAKLAEANTRLTRTGIMGTPAYMSPEQWRGGKEVIDGRADIYALGIMIYEMLSGQLPFEVDTPAQMMYRHLIEPPARLLDKMPSLPIRCEAVITRALAKNRDDRYGTAAELVQALKGPGRHIPSPAKSKTPTSDTAMPDPQLPASIDRVVEIVDTGRLETITNHSSGPPRVYVSRSQRIPTGPLASPPPLPVPPAPVLGPPVVLPSRPPLPPAVVPGQQPVAPPLKPPSNTPPVSPPQPMPPKVNYSRYLLWLIPIALLGLCAAITILVGLFAASRIMLGS